MTSTEGGRRHRRSTVAIISPTRNEATNIEEFTKRVRSSLRGYDIDWEIVFADDSDDETPEVIRRVAGRGLPVRCVHRDPGDRVDSISGAVRTALETVTADVAVVIDADLQHPPEVLPDLLGPLVAGPADFVIGTRYGGSGSAEGLGSRWRRGASRASALFTKAVFPQYRQCSDLASGLFAFRIADFREGRARSTGFKILPEALVRCDPDVIADVPYSFEDRFDGLSKARVGDGLVLARALLGLRRDTRRLRATRVISRPERYRLPDGTDLRGAVDG